jgi:hypothetical protein
LLLGFVALRAIVDRGETAASGPRALDIRVIDASGRPIEGASVEARVGRRVARATTAADGALRVLDLPNGRCAVEATRDGYMPGERAIELGDDSVEIELTLARGRRFEATLVSPAGAPVPGRVRGAVERESDDQGRFELALEGEGPWDLSFEAAGYAPAALQVTRATESPARVVIERTGSIAGIVRNGESPAEGATLLLAGSGVWPARSATSSADGRFRFSGVPPGVYELRARLHGLVAAPHEGLRLGPQETLEIELALVPGASASGEVRRARDDTPIANAEIVITEEGVFAAPIAARTNAEGRFSVAGLRAMPHRIAVHAEGYVPIEDALTPGSSPVFLLQEAATIRGVVIDERGDPIAGASLDVTGTAESGVPLVLPRSALEFRAALFAQALAGPSPVLPSGELGVTLGEVPPIPFGDSTPVTPSAGLSFTTDAEGAFVMTGVPPGVLQVIARHPEYAVGLSSPVLVVAAGEHEVRIRLVRAARVEGRVTDARGFPIALARLELVSEGDDRPEYGVSGTDGTYAFDGVGRTFTITAFGPDGASARKTLSTQPGRTLEVDLVFEGTGERLSLRVLDGRGFPIAGARLSLRSLRSEVVVNRYAISAEDGTAEIDGLPAPPWSLETAHADYATVTEQIEAGGDRTITLGPSSAVTGVVLDDWTGEPIARAEVRIDGASRFATVTDEAGRFSAGLGEGRFSLTVRSPDHLPLERSFERAARRSELDALDLGELRLAPGGSIAGEVVDARGDTISGAEVALGTDWSRAVRTDARGRYRIRGIAAGDATLTARHPAAGESPPAAVRIRTREETVGPTLRLAERFDPARAELGEGRVTGVAVDLATSGGNVRVARVIGAQARELRAGDELVTIDGTPIEEIEQARDLLRGPEGIAAALEIRRGGELLRVAIPRESYEPGR